MGLRGIYPRGIYKEKYQQEYTIVDYTKEREEYTDVPKRNTPM